MAGDFTRTCSNITLVGTALEAMCRTINQGQARSGISLNRYIANIDGRLTWRRNGNYSASSQNFELDQESGVTFLHCDCQRRDGTWTSSALNLDERISNINGQLTYERPVGHDEL
jgi:hypothetical protein